jgi:hypothetical protein
MPSTLGLVEVRKVDGDNIVGSVNVDVVEVGRLWLSYPSTIVLSRSYILPLLHPQDDIPHRPKQPLAMIINIMNKQEYGLVNDEEWLGISLE